MCIRDRYYNNAFTAVESNSMGIATLQKLDHMGYVNLYKQTKVANVSNEEGERLGFRTTSATEPAIIGNLKKLIDNENIMIPHPTVIQELKDYVSAVIMNNKHEVCAVYRNNRIDPSYWGEE